MRRALTVIAALTMSLPAFAQTPTATPAARAGGANQTTAARPAPPAPARSPDPAVAAPDA